MIASRLGSAVIEERLIGESAAMQRVFQAIRKVSATDVTVLIAGESGTGKELVATEIHRRSARRSGPWVPINCGAIPESLVDSELFGYERGAFTDAKQRRRGCFELAHRGTLFLDEVGELTASSQVRLLRALEAKPVTPIGGERSLHLDVRFVAATNRDLSAEVDAGRFRSDLYWRLNVFTIELTALRERLEDIPLLVEHFVRNATVRHGLRPCEPDGEALAALLAYPWPGNARELRSVIECALIAAEDGVITLADLPPRLSQNVLPTALDAARCPATPAALSAAASHGISLADAVQKAQALVELRMIREALEATDGNRTRAAERLGITRKTLFNKLREFQLEN
jgi:two-component system, NtrC family, response regulator AtoC